MIIIIKKLLFQSISFSTMMVINQVFIKYLRDIYIYTFWSMICLWILSESHIISMDMKFLEDKYKDLDNKYKQQSLEYLDLIKQRHIEFNLICETLNEHSSIIIDCRNQLLEIKNDIKLFKKSSSGSSKSSPNFSILSSTPELSPPPLLTSSIVDDKHLHIKIKGRLNEYLNNLNN